MGLPQYGTNRCPGLDGQPPCGNAISYNVKLCESCQRKADQLEAGISLYASTGTRDLEHYLSGWAAFGAWLAEHEQ